MLLDKISQIMNCVILVKILHNIGLEWVTFSFNVLNIGVLKVSLLLHFQRQRHIPPPAGITTIAMTIKTYTNSNKDL